MERRTLEALCRLYSDYLARDGKSSARQVENIFKLYVFNHPLAQHQASQVSAREIGELLRPIWQAGKGRTAQAVRSHLHAAYAAALGAAWDPRLPPTVLFPDITSNPVSAVRALRSTPDASHRVLNEEELGRFLRHVWTEDNEGKETLQFLCRRLVRLNLYMGGQRAAQLLSARLSAVDLNAEPCATLTLIPLQRDFPTHRLHLIPLEDELLAQVQWFADRSRRLSSPWLFASTTPSRYVRQSDISMTVRRIQRDMVDKKEARLPFVLSDLRRTVEVLLAERGVSVQTLAHLLSRRLSGLQTIHFTMHHYMPEKRDALRLLHGVLHATERS